MARASLTIDLAAIRANWRALDAMTECETGAVVKADAYGLGADQVGPTLLKVGVRNFFVALAEEGAALRAAIGPGPRIFVFSGLMPEDVGLVRAAALVPLLNTPAQLLEAKRVSAKFDAPLTVGFQLDSGMNRLGFEADELADALAPSDALSGLEVTLVMSHLACADEPDHMMNAAQASAFSAIAAHPVLNSTPKSLAATGGVLLGPAYHFDMTRPGIGLYGGLPFADARPVVTLEAPILQIRDVAAGEIVGYGAAYEAASPRRIATLPVGYADGLARRLSAGFAGRLDGMTLPSAGRVSMDLVTLDVTGCATAREGAMVTLLGADQTIDDLADSAGAIGYEVLTSLGSRYARRYRDA
ncbi:alanine racemase [Pikeienuella piscinae]|uniref:Alanine racemase n=1 Tax=Pikeienuella piscinae TaxID=2748098 RepID=A0A7L5BWB5_9RHOB|nr:alanine racemase [Pikeienuella piscinae]QIE54526.1 alanine racemase [Pikeienuella piscinae]